MGLSDRNLRTDDIALGPILMRHALIHDGHAWGVGDVAVGEFAALQDRDMHGPEEVRRDRVDNDAHALVFRGLIACDADVTNVASAA